MSTSVYDDSRSSSTHSTEFNVTQNDTAIPVDENSEMNIIDILRQQIYDNIHNDTDYLLIVLYVLVMALAVTANVLVIAVVFKYHYMRSVTNYFVVNLSVADLLVTTICMPMAVSQAVSTVWDHGEVMCKLVSYLQAVAVAASVFTITAMSIDRYLAIRSPMAFRRVFNRKSTVLVIVALWLIALIIFAPVLKVRTLHIANQSDIFRTTTGNFSQNFLRLYRLIPPQYVCGEDFELLGIQARVFGPVWFMLVYAIPGSVVVLAYSMMGRTLCSRRPPFDCDSVEGSASSQQSVQGTAVIDDVCAGCSTGGGSMRRGLLRKRRMLPSCGCGLPIGGHHAVLALKRTTTSSSGYDSFYSRHSPHRRCYMLRSLRMKPSTLVGQPAKAGTQQETCYEKNEHEGSQPRGNTTVTTDEQRCS
ncbi:orexin receptor type 2-like isoform X2 [Hylaeus anthracinus]|uniref:orexin receptor type 2-like isoform X2 n=1 Tax=Hylaeus anthracinus TaxID=313031 RepID=UPI0023B9FFA3|nr:orexin receptor type 2-like isoform X2 [Hylaeus anthracinus]